MKLSVIQTAYVTRNLEQSVDFWVETFGAGPFFFSDAVAPERQIYRGQPTDCRFSFAVGYAGDMQIEVVRQENDAPSAFTELLDGHKEIPVGGLYHHVQLAHDGYDAAYDRILAAGAQRCFDAYAPGVGRFCFIDARSWMGCYVELAELSPPRRMATHAKMRELHKAWDGRDPMRSFGDLVRMMG